MTFSKFLLFLVIYSLLLVHASTHKSSTDHKEGTNPFHFHSPTEVHHDHHGGNTTVHPHSKEPINQGRIINGWRAKVGQWPFMVSVQRFSKKRKKFLHWCGGSILTDEFILTAAHCIKPPMSAFRVLVGTVSLNTKQTKSNYFKVRKMIPHEKFMHDHKKGGYLNGHDVALLKLKGRINMKKFGTKRAQQICLPGPKDVPIGKECAVMGWGLTLADKRANRTLPNTHMETVNVKLIKLKTCAKKYPYFDANSIICVDMNKRGSCSGDSGTQSPLGLLGP